MNYAFEPACKAFTMPEAAQSIDGLNRCAKAMAILAGKAGIYGMIGGQTVDVELTNKPVPREKLDFIYRLKTGALLEASMMIGAVLAGASDEEIDTVEKIAANVGMAFQIQDDILDVTGNEAVIGKPVGSDEKNNKTTYVTLEGLANARTQSERLSDEAVRLLHSLPGKNEFLEGLIRLLIYREK